MVYHRTFTYFAIMLICSSAPLITFAQETATLPDVLTATADAERDADVAVNPYRWIGYGCLISCLGTAIGSMAEDGSLRCIGVYLLTTSAAITEVYFRRPDPPPERFIGKSPEYIDTYISTYKAKRGSQQAKWAAVGCLGGICLKGAMFSAYLYLRVKFALRNE